jgi:hypothetical protein
MNLKDSIVKCTTFVALDPNDSQRRKTMLRMLLFNIFTRYFSGIAQEQEHIPLWLEEMCAAVKKNGGFTQGMDYFLIAHHLLPAFPQSTKHRALTVGQTMLAERKKTLSHRKAACFPENAKGEKNYEEQQPDQRSPGS